MKKLTTREDEQLFNVMIQQYMKRYAKEALKFYALRTEESLYIDDENQFSNKKEQKEINTIRDILTSNSIHKISEKARQLRQKSTYKDFSYMKGGSYEQKVQFVKKLLNTEIDVLRTIMKENALLREQQKPVIQLNQATQISSDVKPASESATKEHLFSTMIPLYIDDRKVEKNWGDKNIKRVKQELQVALKILGDKELSDYTREDFVELRKTLMKLPANVKKISKFKNKSYKEIATINSKTNEFETIAIKTINTKITVISAFFEWVELHQYSKTNYAKKLTIKPKNKAIDDKLPFEYSDLPLLLNGLYSDVDKLYDKKPANIWIPLIGLYNGMRLEEIAQMHVKDIYQDKNNIWVFDLNLKSNYPAPINKSLKNLPSKRIIPIHPTLIKLGLIDFFLKTKQKAHNKSWLLLIKSKNHGFGRTPARWFNEKIKKVDRIENLDKKSMHSTRHTFIQISKENKMDVHILKAITGHEDKDIDYNTYGKAITAKQMLEEIVKVEYPVIEEFFSGKLK